MKFLLSVFILCSISLAETLVFAADYWMPFTGEPNSEEEGFLVELAREIFKGTGIEVQYKLLPWARAIREGELGRIDGLLGAAKGDAPEYLFPEISQGELRNDIISLKPFDYHGLSSLKGKRLGVMQGYTYGELKTGENLDHYIEAGKDIEIIGGEVPLETAIKMLVSGRIDLFIDHPAPVRKAIQNLGLEFNQFSIIESVTKPQELFIAVSPKHSESLKLIGLISEGTKKLKDSGELDKLQKKYGL